jgi:hypothetical protein
LVIEIPCSVIKTDRLLDHCSYIVQITQRLIKKVQQIQRFARGTLTLFAAALSEAELALTGAGSPLPKQVRVITAKSV